MTSCGHHHPLGSLSDTAAHQKKISVPLHTPFLGIFSFWKLLTDKGQSTSVSVVVSAEHRLALQIASPLVCLAGRQCEKYGL